MTQPEEFILRDLISKIYNHRGELGDSELSFFCALRGSLSQGQLMVFGRAVNGWTTKCKPGELGSAPRIDSLIREMKDFSELGDRCPMRWVIDLEGAKPYNTRKSAFWRVIHAIKSALEPTSRDQSVWSSSLMWSNLYKVSPFKGGNPSSALMRLQLPFCFRLLEQEISQWSPKRLLFLTGLDWALPFLRTDHLSFEQQRSGSVVESIGLLHFSSLGLSIPTVIAPHPQGKPEATIVREIIKAFVG